MDPDLHAGLGKIKDHSGMGHPNAASRQRLAKPVIEDISILIHGHRMDAVAVCPIKNDHIGEENTRYILKGAFDFLLNLK